MSAQNVMTVRLVVAEIFQSGQERLKKQLTERHYNPLRQGASMTKDSE